MAGKGKMNIGVTSLGRREPLGYEDEKEFVSEAIQLYHKDVQADAHNIEPAREDMQFVVGDQWDVDARARRERLAKPVLTVNRLPAFVAQYVGASLQSDVTIKLLPARGGTRTIAEIRQGIIRTITRTREAKNALDTARTASYICGIGNFAVDVVDAKNDVFLRDITLKTLDDPFSVIWDRASTEPTGADAQHCFVFSYMTKDDFKSAYPDAAPDSGWPMGELDSTVLTGYGWETDEMVRVAQFWQMREEPVTLGLEAETGDVIDITEMTEEEYYPLLAVDDNGEPIIRETVKPYAECYVMTANQVLEGPYRLDISRLPVFRVEGWTLQEASVRFRWGFVRNAKDPQRLHNYWRSILAEELMKSPASKWLLDAAAMKNGLADQFRNAHLTGDNVLFWDSQSEGARPEYLAPPPINQAVLTEAGMTIQDIRDVTNRHEASMGQTSNEVSGKAITARQRVSELGDIIYIENMNAAIAEAGRVINELIPYVYDTNRTVKITGDDDVESLQEINGNMGDKTPDVTTGKYDITYATGPSYATKRQEAVDIMMTLMNTMPQVGNVVADIIVRNMDIPGAEEIEERLASMLPPGMINPDRLPAARRERVMKQQEAQQKAQQEQQQVQMEMLKRQMGEIDAKIAELTARAQRQTAQAKLAKSQIGVDAYEAQLEAVRTSVDAAETGAKIDMMSVESMKMGLDVAGEDSKSRKDEAAAAKASAAGKGSESGE